MHSRDTDSAKPDVRATERAATTPQNVLVSRVREFLGVPLTMYLADVKEPRTFDRWIERGEVPLVKVQRLQAALAAALVLQNRYDDPQHIAAWFTWLSETLDDTSPAAFLRAATSPDDAATRGRDVVRAARLYLAD
jgi:hypothetical protein